MRALRAAALALALVPAASAPVPELQLVDLDLPATARLDAMLAQRPGAAADLVRALLAEPQDPRWTTATVYMRRDGEPGFQHEMDETSVRIHPTFRAPNWFVAFRFHDRHHGIELPEGDIEMAAAPGEHIGEGVYENAQAFAFQDEGRPGLSVKGPCSAEGGRFEILELDRNVYGQVERFGATFETEGCRGFMVFRRGTEDDTGSIDNGAPTFPPPTDPLPTLAEVIAGYAAEDPRLADLEIPDFPAEPTAVLYATGIDWVGRGQQHLAVGVGEELRWNHQWSPARRVADLRFFRKEPASDKQLWEMQFASHHQWEMAPGHFRYAGNFPYQPSGFPGIRLRLKGRGCATATGSFRVLELKRHEDGNFQRFAADFEQHCEGYGPPLRGFVVYRDGVGSGS